MKANNGLMMVGGRNKNIIGLAALVLCCFDLQEDLGNTGSRVLFLWLKF